MELDCVLLGLIRLHNGVTGYELNRVLRESTGYLLSASLSHIYPTLKRLHDRGMVSYRDVPLTNRPNKKVYHITIAGEQELQAWLEAPVLSSLDLKPFLLKMAFSPLMGKATILAHIDRAITQLELSSQDQDHGIRLEMDYLDKETLNQQKAEVLWNGIYTLLTHTRDLQVEQMKEWRRTVENELKETE